MPDVHAVLGGVAAGRDVLAHLINTGDHATFFLGGYQRLSEAYIDPWPVFERVQIDRVEGRPWLEEKVDRFLCNQDRGYFVIEAPAGLGKSAFLAHVVKERGWVHHFVELAPGDAGVIHARRNLAAQIIRAYELSTAGAEVVVPTEAATRPDYLGTLLRDAANRRKQGEKIVVVVDGLDEAGEYPGENVLGLPGVLPRGVYFVVSQRPVRVTLDVSVPRTIERIDPDAKLNELDMQRFLKRVSGDDHVARALEQADSPLSGREFVDTLVDRSGGIWVYVHYVLSEIEQGERLDIRALPKGLWRYYFRFWRRWRDANPTEWRAMLLPLLSTLAAVQEEASLGLLCTLAEVEPRPDLENLMRRSWRAFLTVSRDEKPRYRLYHASLAEFLRGRTDQEDLSADEKDFVSDLAAAVRDAHARIISCYLTCWGGLDNGLPLLANDPAVGDLDGGYGRRYLPAHLEASGRTDDVHRLLACEHLAGPTQRPANTWYLAHDHVGDLGSYLGHVAIARRLALQSAETAHLTAEKGIALALEIRYALVVASIASQSASVPPALLAALLSAGIWRPAQALAHVGTNPNVVDRLAAYPVIAGHCEPLMRTQILREALAAAREIANEEQRARALAGLAPHLPQELLGEALVTVHEITNAMQLASGLDDPGPVTLGEALAGMLAQLPLGPGEVLGELLAAAREIADEGVRAEVLAELGRHMSPELLGEALAEPRRPRRPHSEVRGRGRRAVPNLADKADLSSHAEAYSRHATSACRRRHLGHRVVARP